MIATKFPPAWFLIAALAAILWLPNLFAIGMFVDGMTNALLAENLYLSNSALWEPRIFVQAYSWGTLPVSVFLLSVFYKIFGDYFFVERIYSLCCALLQLGLIHWAWKIFFAEQKETKKYSWFPCLLWLSSPLIGWSYSYNLMENTMSLFVTAAMVVSLRYALLTKNLFVVSFCVSLFLFLAFLTKGPVCLFVFALPILFVGVSDSFQWKKGVVFTLLQLLFFGFLFAFVFSFSAPQNFLHHYLEEQINPSLLIPTNTHERYSVLIGLLKSNALVLLLCCFLFFIPKHKTQKPKNYWRFILLGLCGSLPIMISNKQSHFYLLPSTIPFSIGFAIYLLPLLEWLNERVSQNIQLAFLMFFKFSSVVVVSVCIFLCVTKQGTFIRDNDLLNDLQQVNAITRSETIIRAEESFTGDWYLRGYLLRLYHKRICLPDEKTKTHFYITHKNIEAEHLPSGHKKLMSGKTLDLYKIF